MLMFGVLAHDAATGCLSRHRVKILGPGPNTTSADAAGLLLPPYVPPLEASTDLASRLRGVDEGPEISAGADVDAKNELCHRRLHLV